MSDQKTIQETVGSMLSAKDNEIAELTVEKHQVEGERDRLEQYLDTIADKFGEIRGQAFEGMTPSTRAHGAVNWALNTIQRQAEVLPPAPAPPPGKQRRKLWKPSFLFVGRTSDQRRP